MWSIIVSQFICPYILNDLGQRAKLKNPPTTIGAVTRMSLSYKGTPVDFADTLEWGFVH